MGYAILRVSKRDHRAAVAMSKHALREVHVANAVEGAPKPDVIAGESTTRGVLAALADLKAAAIASGQRWRKDQVEAVDLLVTTSRQDMARMTLEEQNSYFKRSLAWIAAQWPTARVLTAAVHRDETTPHMQVLLAPIDVRGRFAAKDLLGGPGDMSKMQDAFHDQVGRHYKLERGEKGSKATHVPVRTFYAHAAAVLSGKSQPLEEVPAPPESTWNAKLDGSYKKAKEEREAVIQRNNARITGLKREQLQLRAMHPSQRELLATKYRAAKAMEDAAARDKSAAKAMQNDAQERLQTAASLESQTRQLAQSAGNIFEKAEGAKLLDQVSKFIDPGTVNKVAQDLGIRLLPGRGLIDQMRKQGAAKDMLSAAHLLVRKLEKFGQLDAVSGQAEQISYVQKPAQS